MSDTWTKGLVAQNIVINSNKVFSGYKISCPLIVDKKVVPWLLYTVLIYKCLEVHSVYDTRYLAWLRNVCQIYTKYLLSYTLLLYVI